MKEHSDSGLVSIIAFVVIIQTVRKRRVRCEASVWEGKRECGGGQRRGGIAQVVN